jgi:hypothetical protein
MIQARQAGWEAAIWSSLEPPNEIVASLRTIHKPTITPEDHLLVRETLAETPDQEPSRRLLERSRAMDDVDRTSPETRVALATARAFTLVSPTEH